MVILSRKIQVDAIYFSVHCKTFTYIEHEETQPCTHAASLIPIREFKVSYVWNCIATVIGIKMYSTLTEKEVRVLQFPDVRKLLYILSLCVEYM